MSGCTSVNAAELQALVINAIEKVVRVQHPHPFSDSIPCRITWQDRNGRGHCNINSLHNLEKGVGYLIVKIPQYNLTLKISGIFHEDTEELFPHRKIQAGHIEDSRLRDYLIAWALKRHQLNKLSNQYKKSMRRILYGPGRVRTVEQLIALWPEVALVVKRLCADDGLPKPRIPKEIRQNFHRAFPARYLQEVNAYLLAGSLLPDTNPNSAYPVVSYYYLRANANI